MQTHICTNCGHHYTYGYCNKCGQQTTHRITFKHILHDLIHAFTHADKGLLYLFKRLFFYPGIVAYEYIVEGKRKKYFNPYQYLLLIASLGAFIAVNSHLSEKYGVQSPNTNLLPNPEFLQHISEVMLHYYNLLVLLNLPFFSLATFLVYKKYRYNFAEHLTLSAFAVAQNTFYSSLFILFIVIFHTTSAWLISTIFLVSVVYYTISFMQFFRQYSLKGFFRGVGAIILGYIFYELFVMLIIGIGYIIYILFFK